MMPLYSFLEMLAHTRVGNPVINGYNCLLVIDRTARRTPVRVVTDNAGQEGRRKLCF